MSLFAFSDDDKRIFQHRADDGSLAWADPLGVGRRLGRAIRESGIAFDATWDAATADPKHPDTEEGRFLARLVEVAREDAVEALLPVLHAAFGTHAIDPIDGSGLTESQALKNFAAYMRCLADLKKNTSPTPDSSPPTDGHPASDD